MTTVQALNGSSDKFTLTALKTAAGQATGKARATITGLIQSLSPQPAARGRSALQNVGHLRVLRECLKPSSPAATRRRPGSDIGEICGPVLPWARLHPSGVRPPISQIGTDLILRPSRDSRRRGGQPVDRDSPPLSRPSPPCGGSLGWRRRRAVSSVSNLRNFKTHASGDWLNVSAIGRQPAEAWTLPDSAGPQPRNSTGSRLPLSP